MAVFVAMGLGILIGFKWFPEKWHTNNARFQLIATGLLIFSMGVSLGKDPDFMNKLGNLGLESLLYALIPILFSTILVYYFTKKYLEGKNNDSGSDS